MKYPFWLSSVVVMAVISSGLHAQSLVPEISPSAYKAAIEAELTKYGGSRYLYEHADAYERLIQYRALKKLGYDLALSSVEMPSFPDPEIFPDTTISKDIFKTVNTGDQNETTIAVNRTNKQIIVAGANDLPGMLSSGMPAYYSLDGGENWKIGRVPKAVSPTQGVSYVTLGDPSLAAGDSGYFYYAYLTGRNDGIEEDNLMVASSKDGIKWVNGGYVVPQADVSGFEDKENIWVDNSHSSPHYGRIYIAWVHFNSSSGAQGGSGMISWSDNRGKTWSQPIDVMDEIVKFSEVRTGKNGEVLMSFSVEDGQGGGQHYLLVSKDGGNTFTQNIFSDYTLYPPRIDNRPALKGYNGFRAYPYIAHDVDLTTNRIHLVYGSWTDNGVGAQEGDLFYVTSNDLGKNWTKPTPLGLSNPNFNSPGSDRFCPWVSIDQKTGEGYCFYYSSERDPDNLLIGAYRTKLSSGLKDYPTPLEQGDFDPSLLTKTQGLPFVGDYIGSDSWDSVYAAAWTEMRSSSYIDGDVFVFVDKPKTSIGNTGVPVVIRSENIWLAPPAPNPVSSGMLRVSFYLPHFSDLEINLFSAAGVKMRSFVQGKHEPGTVTNSYSVAGIPSGSYILRLSTEYGSVERNVVITN